MTVDQFVEVMDSTGLDVTCQSWPEDNAPPLPWIVYWPSGERVMYADGTIWHSWPVMRVEVYYTELNSMDADAVRNALIAAGLVPLEVSPEDYLPDGKCYTRSWDVEL